MSATSCTNGVDAASDEVPITAILGNWNRYDNQDLLTPTGFKSEINFRSDGLYKFITFDLREIDGTWRTDASKNIVISDNICSFDGTFRPEFIEGKLNLTSTDGFDDECGRSARLSGEWLRTGN